MKLCQRKMQRDLIAALWVNYAGYSRSQAGIANGENQQPLFELLSGPFSSKSK